MIVVYDSLTGKAKSFAQRLGYPTMDIKDVTELNDDVFLVTRNEGYGEIPKSTLSFLRIHYKKVVGMAVSCNPKWKNYYGASGDRLARIYKIHLVSKFDGPGQQADVDEVLAYLNRTL